jgi:acetylornithine deacetylase
LGVGVVLEFADGGLRWMSPSAAPLDSKIVRAAEESWREIFRSDPVPGCFPGATDARLFEAAGIPCVVAGPGALVRAHHADEYVTTDELAVAYSLYLKLATRFLGWTDVAG